MKSVDPKTLDEMVQRLVTEFDPEQVILFGSHAWGTPTDDSDLDLYVVVTTSEEDSIKRMQRAYGCLGRRTVPTDVLVKTRAEVERYKPLLASLEHKVCEQGKVLYERRPQ